MRGARVSILRNGKSIMEVEKGQIHTFPVLLSCRCRSAKEIIENIVKRAGIFVSVQWSKESLDFVKDLREKVKKMGDERKTYFQRIWPTVVEGTCTSGLMLRGRKGEVLRG
jgi:hypothetical protein